jgi:threonine aldolase
MADLPIDLFSDTHSRPTAAMRQAMAEADVGDEQQRADPTTNRLCEMSADLLGKEAAVFLPSGTMCNAISMRVHCRQGDEVILEETAHPIHFEGGGPAALSGVSLRPVKGDRGIYTADAVKGAVRGSGYHAPRSRMVSIEQTANLGGGAVWPLETIREVASVARDAGLAVHMDGARLLNAVVASRIGAADFAAEADSVWFDLSKGLGCPVGAVLAGSRDFIEEAWRWKHQFGGAMRQSGIIAAAGLYALEHHVERLAEDHENARQFARLVSQSPHVRIEPARVETNIVIFDLPGGKGFELTKRLEAIGVMICPFSDNVIRAVTHIDVSRRDVERAARLLVQTIGEIME